MTDEQLAALLGDHFDAMRLELRQLVDQRATELRADMLEKLLGLRSPKVTGNHMGEIFIDGQLAVDIRPILRKQLDEALAAHLAPKPEGAT